MSGVSVFRVEHAEHGCGPYTGYGEHLTRDECFLVSEGMYELVRGMSLDEQRKTHPTPCEDGLPRMRLEEVCGFATLDHLFSWFNEACLSTLRKAGYVVREYLVPFDQVQYGRRQVLFVKDDAEPVATY